MKNVFVTLLVLLTLGLTAYGQQDAQFSQYMLNPLYYNPAFAGADGVTKLTLMHRTQWAGYTSTFNDGVAPTTQVFSMNTPIYKLRSGFGAHIVNDNIGPQNNLEIQASYAYHLGIGDSKLSFGLRLGAYSQSFDYNVYRFINPNDPLLGDKEGKESQVKPDIAAGVYYRHEKYYAGMAFTHLSKAEFDFGVSEQRNPLETHMNFTAGYIHEVNFDLTIIPSILFRSDFNTSTLEMSVLGTYRDKFWGGLSFRQGDASIVMLGYSLLKDQSLRIGYAFDYTIKGAEAKQSTSHEILLSYELPVAINAGKKVVRTPRFRH
jgi:type IX secretion system PorP/SprF family membrane protein